MGKTKKKIKPIKEVLKNLHGRILLLEKEQDRNLEGQRKPIIKCVKCGSQFVMASGPLNRPKDVCYSCCWEGVRGKK